MLPIETSGPAACCSGTDGVIAVPVANPIPVCHPAMSLSRRACLTGTAALFGSALTPRQAAAVDTSLLFTEQGFAYETFDALPPRRLARTDAEVRLGLIPGKPFAVGDDAVTGWVEKSARAVATYYGRFPAKLARMLVLPVEGGGIQGGTTWGYRGPASRVWLGRSATALDLREDWVMVHEMIHMALPQVRRRHAWLSEGIAVYVESIARVQAGDLDNGFIWAEFARAMPQGLPRDGDGGLDDVRSHGRTYWGGAIFCLEADIELRRRTDNRHGLQTALRAINRIADHTEEWPIERVLQAGDNGTGTTVLSDLYQGQRKKNVAIDLNALWDSLGVVAGDSGPATFSDGAPLAGIRKAITATAT